VLGHLDELILLPLGIWLVIRLIPPEIMAEHRVTASAAQGRRVSRAGAVAVVAAWLSGATLIAWLLCF
jgi:hypothetical protein